MITTARKTTEKVFPLKVTVKGKVEGVATTNTTYSFSFFMRQNGIR
jgi:hypothetical protein